MLQVATDTGAAAVAEMDAADAQASAAADSALPHNDTGVTAALPAAGGDAKAGDGPGAEGTERSEAPAAAELSHDSVDDVMVDDEEGGEGGVDVHGLVPLEEGGGDVGASAEGGHDAAEGQAEPGTDAVTAAEAHAGTDAVMAGEGGGEAGQGVDGEGAQEEWEAHGEEDLGGHPGSEVADGQQPLAQREQLAPVQEQQQQQQEGAHAPLQQQQQAQAEEEEDPLAEQDQPEEEHSEEVFDQDGAEEGGGEQGAEPAAAAAAAVGEEAGLEGGEDQDDEEDAEEEEESDEEMLALEAKLKASTAVKRPLTPPPASMEGSPGPGEQPAEGAGQGVCAALEDAAALEDDEADDAGMGLDEEGEYTEDMGAADDERLEEGLDAADLDVEGPPAAEEAAAHQTVAALDAPGGPPPQTAPSSENTGAAAPSAPPPPPSEAVKSDPASAAPAAGVRPAVPEVPAGLGSGQAAAAARAAPPGARTPPPPQSSKVPAAGPPAAPLEPAAGAEPAAVSPPRASRKQREKIPFLLPAKAARDPASSTAGTAQAAAAPVGGTLTAADRPQPHAAAAAARHFAINMSLAMPPLHAGGTGPQGLGPSAPPSGVQPIPHPAQAGMSAGASLSLNPLQQLQQQQQQQLLPGQQPSGMYLQPGLQPPNQQGFPHPEGASPLLPPSLAAARAVRGGFARGRGGAPARSRGGRGPGRGAP
ncbi:MAG: hypothetical protein WDW36_005157 [Sanguina aurantia]